MLNAFNKVFVKDFCQKIFCPCFDCLKSFPELNKKTTSLDGHKFLNNFNKISMKKLVRKHFVVVFIVWNALLSENITFLSNKTHSPGCSQLFNNLNKISMKKVLSGNILSHSFSSEMFFRAAKWNFLAIKFILLAGRDCWKYLLNLQLCRAVLSSCPTKNSWEVSFCNWSVKIFQFLFSICLVKIVVVKLSERPDSKVSYRKHFSFLWVLRNWISRKT